MGTLSAPPKPQPSAASDEALLEAVARGGVANVRKLLAEGVSPDAKDGEGRSALFLAAQSGNVEIVDVLLQHGADARAAEKHHGQTPVLVAGQAGHADVVRLLLKKDAGGAGAAAWAGVYSDQPDVLRAALEARRVSADDMTYLLEEAEANGKANVASVLRQVGTVLPSKADRPTDPVLLGRCLGRYKEENGTGDLIISINDGALHVSYPSYGTGPFPLAAFGPADFRQAGGVGLRLMLECSGNEAVATVKEVGSETRYRSVARTATPICGPKAGTVAFSVDSSRQLGGTSTVIPAEAAAIRIAVTVPANKSGAGECKPGDQRVDAGTCPEKGECVGFTIMAGQGAGLDACHDAEQTLGPFDWPLPQTEGVKLAFSAVTDRVSTARVELTCKPR
jgi:hypothetical protein